MLEHVNVARLAYHLDTARALGHVGEFDLMEGPLNLAVCVYFNDHLLDLWTVDTTVLVVDVLDGSHAMARQMGTGSGKVDWDSGDAKICWQLATYFALYVLTSSKNECTRFGGRGVC